MTWNGIYVVTDPTWGDNGKGKIVDLLADRAEMSIRYNGGPNAGHTVRNEHGEFKFHLMPSAIFNPQAVCVLADAVVIDPKTLAEEIIAIREAGIEITAKNLMISRAAHMIMPWHRDRDNLRETVRGEGKIGTTGRGIGPTYADRTERVGLQMKDLIAADFEKRLETEMAWQEKLVALMRNDDFTYDRKAVMKELMEAREILAPLIADVMPAIEEYYSGGKRILGEAGQGTLLDLDRGTYPYVTSSHPGIVGFSLTTGIPPRSVDKVIAVTKAYTTRVGEGPLPAELLDADGEKIREVGHEYGTTTGRPRRCGWLDIPALRYGVQVAGADELALTKIDVFDDFSEVKICVAYEINGKRYDKIPSVDIDFLKGAKPILETMPGWKSPTSAIRALKDMPKEAQAYINKVEELVGKDISIVSVGPAREETMYK